MLFAVLSISSRLVGDNSMGLSNNQIHKETVQNYANIIEVLKLKCGGKKKHIKTSFICCLQASTVNHNKSIGAANIYSLNTQMIAILVNNSHIKIVFYTICICT